MRNLAKYEELCQSLERIVKSGSVHVVFRDAVDHESAIEGEILIDHTYDAKAPVLKIKKDDGTEFLYTESDRLFREFLENVFEVGTVDVKGYEPGVFFKLHADANGDTGFNQETINAFYNEMKNDDSMRPYLPFTKSPSGQHALYPFMDTGHVYFDISEALNGESKVLTLSEVITTIFSTISNVQVSLNDYVSNISSTVLNVASDLRDAQVEQNKLIDTMQESIESNRLAIDDAIAEINTILGNAQTAVSGIDFSLTANTVSVIPVRIKVPGKHSLPEYGGIGHRFQSPVYIATEDFSVVAKIGDNVSWTDSDTIADIKANDWLLNKTKANATTMIYDVLQIDNDEFLVFLRTGNYKIFNSDIASVVITPELNGYNGHVVRGEGYVYNIFVNGPLYKDKAYVHRFTNGTFIADKLSFANGIELRFE